MYIYIYVSVYYNSNLWILTYLFTYLLTCLLSYLLTYLLSYLLTCLYSSRFHLIPCLNYGIVAYSYWGPVQAWEETRAQKRRHRWRGGWRKRSSERSGSIEVLWFFWLWSELTILLRFFMVLHGSSEELPKSSTVVSTNLARKGIPKNPTPACGNKTQLPHIVSLTVLCRF